MPSIFPCFRHSVGDEPKEDWTVEEVMQWCLLRCHEATDSKKDELTDALNQQLDAGAKELWQAHEIAAASASDKDAVKTENDDPQVIKQSEVNDDDDDKKTKSAEQIKYIHVQVTEGPYKGKSYKLQPKPRAPCWVGRSAGKKFRDRGISLANDEEVSTTHGKFEIKSGKATFTDTGSTNGTVHEGKELEDNVALELKDGTLLKLGCTVVKITLLRV